MKMLRIADHPAHLLYYRILPYIFHLFPLQWTNTATWGYLSVLKRPLKIVCDLQVSRQGLLH